MLLAIPLFFKIAMLLLLLIFSPVIRTLILLSLLTYPSPAPLKAATPYNGSKMLVLLTKFISAALTSLSVALPAPAPPAQLPPA